MPRRNGAQDQRGVTLTELLVALAIFALIMTGVIATWSKAQEAYFVGSDVAELQQNVRTALDFIVREIASVNRDVTDCSFDFILEGSSKSDCQGSGGLDKTAQCKTKLGGVYATSTYRSGNGCTGLYSVPFADATDTTLRIRADRDDSGMIAGQSGAPGTEPPEEDVIYRLEDAASGNCPPNVPACITRQDQGAAGRVAMIAVDVSELIFEYFPRPGSGSFACSGSNTICTSAFTPNSNAKASAIERVRITVKAFSRVAGNDVTRTLVSEVFLRNR